MGIFIWGFLAKVWTCNLSQPHPLNCLLGLWISSIVRQGWWRGRVIGVDISHYRCPDETLFFFYYLCPWHCSDSYRGASAIPLTPELPSSKSPEVDGRMHQGLKDCQCGPNSKKYEVVWSKRRLKDGNQTRARRALEDGLRIFSLHPKTKGKLLK